MHTDMVKEARHQKHTYVCSEERTVMYCVNVNGGESSSDLCMVRRAAGARLLT